MKTASFYFKTRHYGNRSVTVTLKNDGKISVSISQPKLYSIAERYQMKKKAEEIVKGGFTDPSIYHMEASDDALIAALRSNTAELKADYIAWTKDYARKYFDHVMSHGVWTKEQWLEKYGKEVEKKRLVLNPVTLLYENKMQKVIVLNREGSSIQADLFTFKKIGFDSYQAKEVAHAERHYEDSLGKLASRLKAKGLISSTAFTISHARVGVNLEMTIHHDGMQTRAWTFVAAQDSVLVRPHYRYLVK